MTVDFRVWPCITKMGEKTMFIDVKALWQVSGYDLTQRSQENTFWRQDLRPRNPWCIHFRRARGWRPSRPALDKTIAIITQVRCLVSGEFVDHFILIIFSIVLVRCGWRSELTTIISTCLVGGSIVSAADFGKCGATDCPQHKRSWR